MSRFGKNRKTKRSASGKRKKKEKETAATNFKRRKGGEVESIKLQL